MTYNNYMNEEEKACDLNVKIIYDHDIKLQYCKLSNFQVGRDSHMIENISVSQH